MTSEGANCGLGNTFSIYGYFGPYQALILLLTGCLFNVKLPYQCNKLEIDFSFKITE